MKKITQDQRYRQSLIEYSYKYSVTKAAIKYKTNRQYIYRWRRRYDGTLASLKDRSRRPHSHPNQHTSEEIKFILDMRRRSMHTGLVIFWVKLRQRGYTRSITGLYRLLRRLGRMTYPGERVQIDIKHVPAACLVGEVEGQRFYQYTAIDEFSRLRYLEAFQEASTYSSACFTKHGFSIQCVQTDNGFEFTNRFSNGKPTFFEKTLSHLGIQHKPIRSFTPRHNGKVERSHRKDNEYFYAVKTFFSFSDFKTQLAVHNRAYNRFPMRPLNWLSPLDFLAASFPPFATYV